MQQTQYTQKQYATGAANATAKKQV